MIVNLLTAIAVAAVVILMIWAGFRTLRRPMPRSLIPLVVGGCVISYGIYSEYTWESRTLAQLPESIAVVHRMAGRSAFSPLSYVIERTDQLSMVDTANMRRHPDYPDYAMVDLLLMARFTPVVRVRQLVDCRGSRRADLSVDPVFDQQGLPIGLQWDVLPTEHALLNTVCRNGGKQAEVPR